MAYSGQKETPIVDNLRITSGFSGKRPGWSLYVHIPFCEYHCRYCDFYFETTRSRNLQTKLVDALLQEALVIAEGSGTGGPGAYGQLETLYLGGGTPSALAPDLLVRLLQGFKILFGLPVQEGTLEANPEGVTLEFLEILQRGGITRLSVGVQSLDDQVLESLGRRAWKATTLNALELVKSHWGNHWNLDIMTGLPGQTWESLHTDMDRLLAFGPDHVSLYSLTLEPGTPLETLVQKKQIHLPSGEMGDDLWLRAKGELESRGFLWYEISNFALPGGESKHNQVYWRMDPYVGLGPGAHGTIFHQETGGAIRTVQGKLFDYLAGVPAQRELLAPSSFFLEHLMAGLRTAQGIPWTTLENRFGVNLQTAWSRHWISLHNLGWLDIPLGGTFTLTESGRLMLDRVLETLLPWVDELGLTQVNYQT